MVWQKHGRRCSKQQTTASKRVVCLENGAVPLEILLGPVFGVEVVKIARHVALWGDAVSGGREPDAGDAHVRKLISLVHQPVVPALLPRLPVESLPKASSLAHADCVFLHCLTSVSNTHLLNSSYRAITAVRITGEWQICHM